MKKPQPSKVPVFLEMILLATADMLGSQLRDKNVEEFKLGENFLSELIDGYS